MGDAWYVSAQERIFGPYSRDQLNAYISEKRITAHSMVRYGEEGTFVPARSHAALARQFGNASIASDGISASAPATRAAPAKSAAPEMTNYLLIVEFRSVTSTQFESEIRKFGRSFRLNRSTWLLQSEAPANVLKTSLAPYIGSKDPLLIVDCVNNRLAWHNLGVFEASSIRDLWKMPSERV